MSFLCSLACFSCCALDWLGSSVSLSLHQIKVREEWISLSQPFSYSWFGDKWPYCELSEMWWGPFFSNFFCLFVSDANSSRQVQNRNMMVDQYRGSRSRRLSLSPEVSPGQMENKPLYLHGMLHWPSPSTRLRLCQTKQLVNELLWSGASGRTGPSLLWCWEKMRHKAPVSLLLF